MVDQASAREGRFFAEYDLRDVRDKPPTREAASHQARALRDLQEWFRRGHAPAGGIVVIPTGGGKTFVAVRFLCGELLSSGYKVLWLAHTHHLLEQAFDAFVPRDDEQASRHGYEIARIAEPRPSLAIRVVSGTTGHFPVHTVKPTDDVVIGTLQTIARAHGDKGQKGLAGFLESSTGRLAVVFDEAHHSPAPSYRRLVEAIREAHPKTLLLGLTATPTYTDEKKQGWLKRLFPQGIVTQCSLQRLMADRVLARPILEEATTSVVPDFSEREFQKWVGTYQDIPEDLIESLARNKERNAAIVERYVRDKARYGKTIIFADRWYQCDFMREMLRKRGVRADVIYSHVDASGGSPEERNRRARDENAKVLEAFRRNRLDVLINVKMLTEGTDIPDVKSVFLTRQTTSRILLTQMVGRALRGPHFGGTDEAYIVSFIDSWKQAISWATYDQLGVAPADETVPEYGKRPPLQLISIELVRRLSRQIDQGILVADAPFLRTVPVGWYRVEFEAVVEGSEDTETVRHLVLVFDGDRAPYESFISGLKPRDLAAFASETVRVEERRPVLEGWLQKHFPSTQEASQGGPGGDLPLNLFHIARHMAQADGEPPPFFPFADRDHHDLDAIARQFSFEKRLDSLSVDASLNAEYTRKDRYWRVLYPSYDLLKSQYDACVNRLLRERRGAAGTLAAAGAREAPTPGPPGLNAASVVKPRREALPEREPSEELKEQVKARDGYRCLCCGETSRRRLVIDHVAPSYYGGDSSLDNLQTLCTLCNGVKAIRTLNFHVQRTTLDKPGEFQLLDVPKGPRPPEVWAAYVARVINLFYQCRAVEFVRIGRRGPYFYVWHVMLFAGNDPRWLKPFLPALRDKINEVKERARDAPIQGIRVGAPDRKDVTS